jgi:hypothetical protein
MAAGWRSNNHPRMRGPARNSGAPLGRIAARKNGPPVVISFSGQATTATPEALTRRVGKPSRNSPFVDVASASSLNEVSPAGFVALTMRAPPG